MNATPSSDRLHIAFFGRRNAGKSSLVNAVTNQDLAIVSDTKGTTTDPVLKAMELLPLGPVVIIDTPGYDDEGELGELRIKKTRQSLNRSDIAILVVDVNEGLSSWDEELLELFEKKEIPYLTVFNQCDRLADWDGTFEKEDGLYVSATEKKNIYELKEKIGSIAGNDTERKLVADLVKEGDFVVLVIPIDEAAPKGRIILPQQQAIRDLLEASAVSICVKETELADLFASLAPRKPDLVITDSQAFEEVAKIVPQDVMLTSFSILMARKKGFLKTAVSGVKTIDNLKDGDKVLISEGCTHHRQCNDIGTVKIPNWLKKYTGKDLVIETSSGRDFPDDISEYALIIHCGGCMLNEREVRYRMKTAVDAGIPFTNYGICIAKMKGIIGRSTEILKEEINL